MEKRPGTHAVKSHLRWSSQPVTPRLPDSDEQVPHTIRVPALKGLTAPKTASVIRRLNVAHGFIRSVRGEQEETKRMSAKSINRVPVKQNEIQRLLSVALKEL